jgi:hypothetical protein
LPSLEIPPYEVRWPHIWHAQAAWNAERSGANREIGRFTQGLNRILIVVVTPAMAAMLCLAAAQELKTVNRISLYFHNLALLHTL